MSRLLTAFSGTGLMARVLRSASWLMVGYGGSQALRLAANLIMTRLLFPEAFGIMTLVTVVVVGLSLFSDVGVGPSIAQNPRGDDPDFLNTAWTIQVFRGCMLFAVACLLTVPVARFYQEPELVKYLPVGALALLVSGFFPTRIETAHRHLLVGRLTVLDLASQAIGIGFMVIYAELTQSVMALALGGVVSAVAKLLLTHFLLPGPVNRFRWEPAAANDLIHFGKWIFLSTALTFVISQGDRAILGRYLSIDMLGIYNIGYFLGSFPMMAGLSMIGRIMIPVYRDKPPAEGDMNRRYLSRLRAGMSLSIGLALLLMAAIGPQLVGLLYDARYQLAGPMVTLISLAFYPRLVILTYDNVALAMGDSRSYFIVMMVRAVFQIFCIILGLALFGLVGGIASMAVATVASYPAVVWLARKYGAWDAGHDVVAILAGLLATALILWMHWADIALLSGY
ncbi:oligosaccharide flippase family protein [Ruegeria marina]|uniref:Membrane protein involved in the export of O-antigen and teichoic acid n=1 Tax=Ruegeria marina TaxID=639004 RepID=A0A1G6T5A4_9RHOB|nr:oligosaccharide flippase family protein [Ruegeria marina]SDD24133.1 Membrane protein involved in the export of O-antigen and teichoic acid [Ruegeria marina]